jgi:hypothetical protein
MNKEVTIDYSGSSGVAKVTTADGNTFDMLRWAKPESANARGKALLHMRELVQEFEPESLSLLQTSQGLSAEYATSAAIARVKSPELKTKLVRVAVAREMEENDPAEILRVLEYSHASKLDLPELNEKFINQLYDSAMAAGKYDQAESIAYMMAKKGQKIIKTETRSRDASDHSLPEWNTRQAQALDKEAQQVIEGFKNGLITADDWRLESVFNSYKFLTKAGYPNPADNPTAFEIARLIVQADLKYGRKEVARMHAEMAHTTVAALTKGEQADSSTEDGQDWGQNFRKGLAKLFGLK